MPSEAPITQAPVRWFASTIAHIAAELRGELARPWPRARAGRRPRGGRGAAARRPRRRSSPSAGPATGRTSRAARSASRAHPRPRPRQRAAARLRGSRPACPRRCAAGRSSHEAAEQLRQRPGLDELERDEPALARRRRRLRQRQHVAGLAPVARWPRRPARRGSVRSVMNGVRTAMRVAPSSCSETGAIFGLAGRLVLAEMLGEQAAAARCADRSSPPLAMSRARRRGRPTRAGACRGSRSPRRTRGSSAPAPPAPRTSAARARGRRARRPAARGASARGASDPDRLRLARAAARHRPPCRPRPGRRRSRACTRGSTGCGCAQPRAPPPPAPAHPAARAPRRSPPRQNACRLRS